MTSDDIIHEFTGIVCNVLVCLMFVFFTLMELH